jgi:DNA primase
MAGPFSDATLEQVRAASDIVEIIGSYVPLKRAGGNFSALCPFHKEKTPSFNVNPQRQFFHCFGCHKGGDVFRFVQEYEGIGFVDAVRRLAERARIPIETSQNPAQAERRHVRDLLLQLHEGIAQRWQSTLLNEAGGQPAREYLARRGVSDEAVRLFRLGAAPESWDDTANWARSKGYETTLVEQAGLILRKEDSDRYYDRFRGRLMFPICDEQGRVIGFSGRILSGDEKTAKYVNSPETPIFVKGRVFYGLDKSKRALLDSGYAVVCEGQLDLIACYSAGVHNVVAPQGTALTAEHARILRRYVEEVVLCFDADNAGRNAAIRSLDELLASGIAVRVATIPSPHDPDSFIREFGAEAFRQQLEGAPGFFDFYLDHLCAMHDPAQDRGRLTILRSMSTALHKTRNAVLLDTHAQKTAHRLGVSVDAVRTEFRKRPTGPPMATTREENESEAEVQLPRPPQHEFWLLKLLLIDDQLLDWASANLERDWITHPAIRKLVELRLAADNEGHRSSLARISDDLEEDAARSLLTEAALESREVPNRARQLVDTTQRLRDQAIDRQLAARARDLAHPDLDDESRRAIMEQQQALRRAKREPLPPLDG